MRSACIFAPSFPFAPGLPRTFCRSLCWHLGHIWEVKYSSTITICALVWKRVRLCIGRLSRTLWSLAIRRNVFRTDFVGALSFPFILPEKWSASKGNDDLFAAFHRGVIWVQRLPPRPRCGWACSLSGFCVLIASPKQTLCNFGGSFLLVHVSLELEYIESRKTRYKYRLEYGNESLPAITVIELANCPVVLQAVLCRSDERLYLCRLQRGDPID